MKISVVIPTYNSARTIEATLDSVLRQTMVPDEVLVLDDGSSDHTVSLLRRHVPRVTLLQQPNAGVARARNVLVERAQGDLIAFLDHDDLWHPEYLAEQKRQFCAHPQAVAFFTAHQDLVGDGLCEWKAEGEKAECDAQVISGLEFLGLYSRAMGQFGSMSFCCIPKNIFNRLGPEPFCPEVPGVDDFYLFHTLMLLGSIVFNPRSLAAYRITPNAQSANLLKSVQKAARALELLDARFKAHPDRRLGKCFQRIFSAQRRECGRVLMGAGRAEMARQEFMKSLAGVWDPASQAKSVAWWLLTWLPGRLQPRWPAELKASHTQAPHNSKAIVLQADSQTGA